MEKKQLHKVSAELLHKALPFVATDDPRYYLLGVHIRKAETGSIVEGCNGHMACVLHDVTGESTDKDVVIESSIIKLLPKKGDVIIYDDESIEFTNILEKTPIVNLTFKKALIDGSYPDINRVIPKHEDMKAGLNFAGWLAAYLIKAIQFFNKSSRAYLSGFLCYQTGDSSSAVFMSPDKKAMIIIMPQRVEEDQKEFSLPDWLGSAK